MNSSTLFLLISLALVQTGRAGSAAQNLWTNGSFEDGQDLDSAAPVLEGWQAGGNNPAIDVVIREASVDGDHALAVRDDDPAGYGEWFSERNLAGVASEGDVMEISWSEMYTVGFGEMRLTILFFNGEGAVASQHHFVTRGESAGWAGTAAGSTFTLREESLIVPPGAVRMTVSLVSGGPSETTGFMAIDGLCVRRPAQPVILPGNLWPNPSFELGENLDGAIGEVEAWNRGGSEMSIAQVTSEVSVSPGHALLVRDEHPQGYGEWSADLNLGGGPAIPGATLRLQWFQLHSISGGEMRLTALFLDSGGQVASERHFTATGQSEGWNGTLTGSAFHRREETLLVPGGATTLRLALVSGGSESTTGVLAIDDLSVAVAAEAQVLADNFWLNPGFEEGAALDRPDGTPANWNRGGSEPSLNQVTAAVSLSPTHALAVIDGSVTDYGEWYADQALAGAAEPGDALDVQWFELHDVSADGAMRLTILFLSSEGAVLAENHQETRGQSAGWAGGLEGSAFTRRHVQVIVPQGAATLRVALVSGGPVETTGVMVIDDLSVARFAQGEIDPGNFWPNPTFELGTQLDDPAKASPAGWNRGGSNPAINAVTRENAVSPSHALAVIDDDPAGYGEWYQSLALGDLVSPGDELAVKWFEMFRTEGDMRLSFLFFDQGGTIIGERHFIVTGESDGWQGDIASSIFSPREEFLAVPDAAVRMQVGLVSGGSEAVTGLYVIDDLSVSKPPGGPLVTTDFKHLAATNELMLTWQSRSNKTYTIEFSADLVEWTDTVRSNIPATGAETAYKFQSPGLREAYFRVLEE